jgi:hypothetical protein
MKPRLISVEPLSDYRLLLTYENNERRLFDTNPYLDCGIFAQLRDEALFRSVRVVFDTVEWSNGADLCPEVLYARSELQESINTKASFPRVDYSRLEGAKQYHDFIRHILIRDWDPIGVGDVPETQDEYDSYIEQIYGLLIRRETKDKLFDFLWWAVTENMGLAGNRRHTQDIVDKLLQLRESIERQTT